MLSSSPKGAWTLAFVALLGTTAQARVTRIVIDETKPMPVATGSAAPIAYEQIAGRAFGELDAKLPQNGIIQDIELAKDADGKVRGSSLIAQAGHTIRIDGNADAGAPRMNWISLLGMEGWIARWRAMQTTDGG